MALYRCSEEPKWYIKSQWRRKIPLTFLSCDLMIAVYFRIKNDYAKWLIRELFHRVWFSIRLSYLIAEHETNRRKNILILKVVLIFKIIFIIRYSLASKRKRTTTLDESHKQAFKLKKGHK